MSKQNECVICRQPATHWRLFAPYATYPARVAWLCADHVAVSREAFHAACIAHPDNRDIAAYELRNRAQIERERKQADALSQKRKAAIAKRWTKGKAGTGAGIGQFVSETPQIQAPEEAHEDFNLAPLEDA